MSPYQPVVTTSGDAIALFGVEDLGDGRVVALGVFSPKALPRGRILRAEDGARLKTTTPIPAGLSLVGGPEGYGMERPLVLTLKGEKA